MLIDAGPGAAFQSFAILKADKLDASRESRQRVLLLPSHFRFVFARHLCTSARSLSEVSNKLLLFDLTYLFYSY